MRAREGAHPDSGAEERVKPLELFFDLVFVFALTQVTGLVTENPTWEGLAQGLLLLAALWWAWTAYAWLTNTIDPEEGPVRLAFFAVMAAMLIASLAVPGAFGDDALVFAIAFGSVRIGHLVLYALAGRGDPDLLGAAGLDVGFGLIAAACFGLAISAALWWAYFDVVAIVAERKLKETTGAAQNAMARDSYSYLHLPMVAGIILFAVGVKKTLGNVDEPLKLVPAVALCGGIALYLIAHVLFRLRNVRSLNRQRLVVALVLIAFVPIAVELEALVTLGAVAGICAALIAYEAIRFADARERVRHAE